MYELRLGSPAGIAGQRRVEEGTVLVETENQVKADIGADVGVAVEAQCAASACTSRKGPRR